MYISVLLPVGTLGVRIRSCLPPVLHGFAGRLTSPFQSLLSWGYHLRNHTELSPTQNHQSYNFIGFPNSLMVLQIPFPSYSRDLRLRNGLQPNSLTKFPCIPSFPVQMIIKYPSFSLAVVLLWSYSIYCPEDQEEYELHQLLLPLVSSESTLSPDHSPCL